MLVCWVGKGDDRFDDGGDTTSKLKVFILGNEALLGLLTRRVIDEAEKPRIRSNVVLPPCSRANRAQPSRKSSIVKAPRLSTSNLES